MAILEDVLKYTSKNNILSSEFSEYAKMYLMTTENISDYLTKIDVKDKDILTVCGSGDQLLNAYLLGAKDVTCFDVNNLARAILYFKINFIRNLSFEEFLKFFMQENNPSFLNKEIYIKLRFCLPDDIRDLFDFILLENERNYNSYFYSFNTSRSKMNKLNKYLNNYYYEKLSKILKEKEPEFIRSNIKDLPNKLKRNYDIMLFSNISDAIENIYKKDALKQYRDLMLEYGKYLNQGGIIQTGYIYETRKKESESLFGNDKKREKEFVIGSNYELIEMELDGFKEKTKDKTISIKRP